VRGGGGRETQRGRDHLECWVMNSCYRTCCMGGGYLSDKDSQGKVPINFYRHHVILMSFKAL
jgi:hypothetical protein